MAARFTWVKYSNLPRWVKSLKNGVNPLYMSIPTSNCICLQEGKCPKHKLLEQVMFVISLSCCSESELFPPGSLGIVQLLLTAPRLFFGLLGGISNADGGRSRGWIWILECPGLSRRTIMVFTGSYINWYRGISGVHQTLCHDAASKKMEWESPECLSFDCGSEPSLSVHPSTLSTWRV